MSCATTVALTAALGTAGTDFLLQRLVGPEGSHPAEWALGITIGNIIATTTGLALFCGVGPTERLGLKMTHGLMVGIGTYVMWYLGAADVNPLINTVASAVSSAGWLMVLYNQI